MLHQVVNPTEGKTRGGGKIFARVFRYKSPHHQLIGLFKNFAGMAQPAARGYLSNKWGTIHSVWAFYMDTISLYALLLTFSGYIASSRRMPDTV